MATHDPDDLFDQPLEVRVFQTAVVLTGPNGIALAMTVEAARRSAERLREAAETAGEASGDRP
jgi:hypothetical protein